ncbi:MAG: 1-(5-phosphoribosyl)-5-amino-4-imidazole-carboxylate carboxylase [Candidatus Omnitrophica bacterium CG1_02_49_10]|nr:MAG: 1-(5-phosphoribosyl)-5-amino-4-imidazole-carboxylate carboxylase [Candidatus Omnitrophica bacterium CG1_02_49_10]
MRSSHIISTLKNLKEDKLTVRQAYRRLKDLPYLDMGFAKLDNHRLLRKGFSEVVYCRGKSVKQVEEITKKLLLGSSPFILTKASAAVYEKVSRLNPRIQYNESAGIIYMKRNGKARAGYVAVVSAGTSDEPVAEEAAITLEVMGRRVKRLYDVGVAGVHRLFANKKVIDRAKVVIVVAGMDGALASVIGGFSAKPVIAVPTSVGYGANYKGIATLLAMLNSCAPGVAVMNIDNGFGAGYFAGLMDR